MSAGSREGLAASPLLIKVETEFTSIGFGRVIAAPGVVQLRRDLNAVLAGTVGALPAGIAGPIGDLLDTYSGRAGDFFHLFYVPSWSFLHWVSFDNSGVGADLKTTARTAHALSLFLHLWDDHLCDGQLEIDLARLQLRTIAWQRFISSAYELADLAGLPRAIVDQHADEYLSSQFEPDDSSDLDSYLKRFSRQVAIWTLVPRLIDGSRGGADDDGALRRIVDLFAGCWRLVDDLQDIHLDLIAGAHNAVWHALDSEGRRRWDTCRALSRKAGALDVASWKQLAQSIHDSGALARLLTRIGEMLESGSTVASRNGWLGLAQELDQAGKGFTQLRRGRTGEIPVTRT